MTCWGTCAGRTAPSRPRYSVTRRTPSPSRPTSPRQGAAHRGGAPEGTDLVAATTTNSDHVHLELFQANLAEIGITLTVEEMDQATYVGMIYGDAPVERPNFMGQSWCPDNDAWNGVYPLVSCDSWGSKEPTAGSTATRRSRRCWMKPGRLDARVVDEILGKMLTIISRDDPPAIYYAQPKWPTVLQANIEGFFFNPINIGTYDFWKLSGRRNGAGARHGAADHFGLAARFAHQCAALTAAARYRPGFLGWAPVPRSNTGVVAALAALGHGDTDQITE